MNVIWKGDIYLYRREEAKIKIQRDDRIDDQQSVAAYSVCILLAYKSV